MDGAEARRTRFAGAHAMPNPLGAATDAARIRAAPFPQRRDFCVRLAGSAIALARFLFKDIKRLILATVADLQRVAKKSAVALESPCLHRPLGENLGAVIGHAGLRAYVFQ